MLAAECVCVLLSAERVVIRQALSAIGDAVRGGEWRQQGGALERLCALMHFVREFERRCHRPKTHGHLLPVLQARSSRADEAMEEIELAQAIDARLLDCAFDLIGEVAQGERAVANDLKGILQRYCVVVSGRLAREGDVPFAVERGAVTAPQS